MTFPIIKALHIIFVITWFAGLFYIVRLFIYSAEANELEDKTKKDILLEQYEIMKRRLWLGITWPSAILTLIFGTWLTFLYGALPNWLIFKLSIVALLYVYHFSCHKIYKQQIENNYSYNSFQLRVWNEVATLFLFAIVFIVELQHRLGFGSIFAGLVFLAFLLFIAVRFYAKKRES